jgi:hypothetical protein
VITVVLRFFSCTEHRTHLFGLLPYGLVPHLFMHGGQGRHGCRGQRGTSGTAAGW